MLFNSYIFLFTFLPLALLSWHGLNHFKLYKPAQAVLIFMSLWFYGYYNYRYVTLILCSTLINWLISKGIAVFSKTYGRMAGKIFGAAGILFNLSLLFYFKYYNFFIENINLAFHADLAIKNIALPLGISFFTFQQISYVADRMTDRADHYPLIDYMAFVVYFPQLIAGPIVNHRDLVPQFSNTKKRRFRWTNMLRGIRLFTIGLSKKVLLADELGRIVDFGYMDTAALDSPAAFIVMLAFTFQIFFDFSGYCDMALGLGAMMNLDLPQNFDSPYKSRSIKEFWNRWHITLSAFFTKYVYIPLGGNRHGTLKAIRNTMIVFLLSGIWHGANWTFILWGILHGIMVCANHLTNAGKKCPALKKTGIRSCFSWAATFVFVNLAWILFRSDSVKEAWTFYRRLFSFSNTGYLYTLAGSVSSYKNEVLSMLISHLGGNAASLWLYLVWIAALFFLAAFLCTKPSSLAWINEKKTGKAELVILVILFGFCVLSLSGLTTFLYFNF